MPHRVRMTIDERYTCLQICQERYKTANRRRRSTMLDEMEHVSGLNRKTLIRHMRRRRIERHRRPRQRGKAYAAALDDALRVIAESLDYICAERLTPNLVSTARHLAAHRELELSVELERQLERISVSTVRRRLKALARLDSWQLPRRKGPKPPNPATRDVPMKRIPWDEREPGHFETDLVHHSGPIASGDYVHTLLMADVATSSSRSERLDGASQLLSWDGANVSWRMVSVASCSAYPFRYSRSIPTTAASSSSSSRSERQLPPGPLLARRCPGYPSLSQPPLPQERQPLRRAKELYPDPRLPRTRTPGLSCPNPGSERPLRQGVALLQLLPAGAAT